MVNRERGSALLVALVTVLVVSMAMMLLAGFIHQRQSALETEIRNVMIASLADAAMAESLAGLDDHPRYRGFSERTLGKGWISSQVQISKSGFRKITATGRFRGWAATIEGEVDIRSGKPKIISWQYRQGPAGFR